MSTRMGWTVGAACLMIAGFAVLPAPAQDPKPAGQEAGAVRSDKPDGGKEAHRKELDASRERLRAAYRSGDPAAIKAARENYQKLRGETRERDGGAPRPR